MAVIKNIGRIIRSTDDREGIIGSSQVGAVIGLEGYQNDYDVYLAYKGLAPEPDERTKWTFLVGHILEEPIAQLFTARTGYALREVPEALVDLDNPYLICHPDREFVDLVNGKRYAVECKTARSFAVRKKWPDPKETYIPNVFLDFIDPGVEVLDEKGILDQYRAQCYWYTAFGYDGVFLARLTDGDLHIYFVESNPDVEKVLVDGVKEYHDKIESGWAPRPKNDRNMKSAFPEAIRYSFILADDRISSAFNRYLEAQEREKSASEEKEHQKLIIQEYMGENEELWSKSEVKMVSWSNSERTVFDSTGFKKDHPELYAKYARKDKTRTFRANKTALKKMAATSA